MKHMKSKSLSLCITPAKRRKRSLSYLVDRSTLLMDMPELKYADVSSIVAGPVIMYRKATSYSLQELALS